VACFLLQLGGVFGAGLGHGSVKIRKDGNYSGKD